MEIKDQIDRTIELPESPDRILSLVPSITESLIDLGLKRRMVGRTRFCIHPADKVQSIPVIGGVMGLNQHEIDKISPDLILAAKEENAKNEIVDLSKRYPVWISDVHSLEGALDLIGSIGQMCGRQQQARDMKESIQDAFSELSHIPPGIIRAVYLVWNDPLYTINHSAFIHDMLTRCGIENVFADKKEAYPIISEKEIRDRKPDFIFLPTEPYHFRESHRRKFAESFPQAEIKRVDGEYFTWYGSHLIQAPSYFKQLF